MNSLAVRVKEGSGGISSEYRGGIGAGLAGADGARVAAPRRKRKLVAGDRAAVRWPLVRGCRSGVGRSRWPAFRRLGGGAELRH